VIVLSTFKRAGVTLFCVFLRKVFSGFWKPLMWVLAVFRKLSCYCIGDFQ
jgi:hypothetical protein